ncbi:MAG: pirin family protein [Thermoleophilia bacterium]|jgi:redox-sensitive bicupin YhaK (pirin superfamily)|nr:pirin family protein [Thermoleophilia bacterium]
MDREARCVRDVVEPRPTLEGAGVRLRRTIGTHTLDYLDPFLLLDHFASDDPRDYLAGFPWHPHRGIETVTYMLAGEVDHHDSIGNRGTIGPGDVQWMTAGGGILHEEMPRPRDGRMAGFQLWVNLPAALKMTRPRYQEVRAESIPVVRRDDGSLVRVVAGEVDGVAGPVSEIYADPTYLDVTLPPGTRFVHPVPRGHNGFAYVFEGEGRFGVACEQGYRGDAGGELVAAPDLVVFADGDEVTVCSDDAATRFLLASGRPLDEPIARYGPFVMTTAEEIQAALDDLRADSFVWRDDPEWARRRQTWRG